MHRILSASAAILAAAVVLTTTASGAQKARIVAAGSGPLMTGVGFVTLGSATDDQLMLERIAASGAKIARITIDWSQVAPKGDAPPAGFDPTNPADTNYNWVSYDTQIKAIAGAGLTPLLTITTAPTWATPSGGGSYRPGSYKPSPSALGKFATALAERYNGTFEDLPRVKYFSVWNEPNLNTYLAPQVSKGKAFAPVWYRSMINAAANSLHAVHSDNIVVAGDTSPFGGPAAKRTKPLHFMEKVLCVSEKKNKKTKNWTYKSACKAKAKFDVWAHHPYTEGGPTRKGRLRGNVSLGDLGDMRAVLNTAIRAKHVVSSQRVRLWVSEFSWDSRPQDPQGVSQQLQARWVSHALYQAWSSGVSYFNWFILRDQDYSSSYYQSGLYTASADGVASDAPKVALTAFRFPFVALQQSGSKTTFQLWGRTPSSQAESVLIQRKSGSSWKTVKRLNANGSGIFKARIKRPAKTIYLRARLADGSDTSVPFSLNPPKKVWDGCVFGGGDGNKCNRQYG